MGRPPVIWGPSVRMGRGAADWGSRWPRELLVRQILTTPLETQVLEKGSSVFHNFLIQYLHFSGEASIHRLGHPPVPRKGELSGTERLSISRTADRPEAKTPDNKTFAEWDDPPTRKRDPLTPSLHDLQKASGHDASAREYSIQPVRSEGFVSRLTKNITEICSYREVSALV